MAPPRKKTKVRFYGEASLPLNLGQTNQKHELLQASPPFNMEQKLAYILYHADVIVEQASHLSHT